MKNTNFLKLNILGNNEFPDCWDLKMNENFDKIDASHEEITNEINEARFKHASLRNFLAESFDNNGKLKPIPEIKHARNSKIYGNKFPTGIDFELKDVLDLKDFEIYLARFSKDKLNDSLALIASGFTKKNCPYSGIVDVIGNASFLSNEGNKFRITASEETPLFLNINGYLARINRSITVNNETQKGLNYLIAKYNGPSLILDMTGREVDASIIEDGITKDLQIISCPTIDFTTLDIFKGNFIEITSGNSVGTYIIDEIAPNKIKNQLKIIGVFPSSETIQKIKFFIKDPFLPQLEITNSVSSDMCVLGSGISDGKVLTNIISHSYNNKYCSEWRAVDLSSGFLNETTGTFYHNLGKIPKLISVFVSDKSDESSFIQIISISGIESENSFHAKFDKNKIILKNTKSKSLYKDFNLNDSNTSNKSKGFIKVICEA